MDNVHKVKISVHKESFLKISFLSKKQPQENTPRPMACSHVGHAATEAYSQQEDTWRPSPAGPGAKMQRQVVGWWAVLSEALLAAQSPAPWLPGAWSPHHYRHPEPVPVVCDPAPVTSSCPPATAQKSLSGWFSMGSPLPAWPLQRSSSFLACSSGLTSSGKSSRGLTSSDKSPKGLDLEVPVCLSHSHRQPNPLQAPITTCYEPNSRAATSERGWEREGLCCRLTSPHVSVTSPIGGLEAPEEPACPPTCAVPTMPPLYWFYDILIPASFGMRSPLQRLLSSSNVGSARKS